MDQAVAPPPLPLPTTPEEFLAWEVVQEEKYEFDGEGPIPMNGGSAAHARIERNIVGELWQQLRDSPFEAFGGTMKIAIGRRFRYPDACISRASIPPGSIVVPAPVVLFEVVSPSSRTLDHLIKLDEYRSLPSVARYVILEQHVPELTVHARTPVGTWTREVLRAGDVLRMPEVGADIPVDRLYNRVFPTPG